MSELTTLFAVGITLGAALALASQSLFLRIGTRDSQPSDAVFVVILVNLVMLVPPVAIFYYPNYGLTRLSVGAFVAAGLFGTVVGRLLKYTSIKRIGASRTEPITATNALFATVLGVVVLGETLTPLHGVGVVLIVGGVAAIAWETSHENPEGVSVRELGIGLLIPFGAAFAYALEPIFASIGIGEGTPALVGLTIKTVVATVLYASYERWRGDLTVSGKWSFRNVRWFLLAGVANTVFLFGYYVSLSLAPVSVVVPIIITSTLFVVLLSAVCMPAHLERVTWKLIAAATVVVGGVLVITLVP